MPRIESVGRDVVVTSTVLAVVETAKDRVVFFLLPPWSFPFKGPHLGRAWWTERLGGRGGAWGVGFSRPWEGVQTLEMAIRQTVGRLGPCEVFRMADPAKHVAEELALPGAEARAKLNRRYPCDPGCAGWFVGESELERCDSCFYNVDDPLLNDEVGSLPEAQQALREAFGEKV